jgi:hypothetical protein
MRFPVITEQFDAIAITIAFIVSFYNYSTHL